MDCTRNLEYCFQMPFQHLKNEVSLRSLEELYLPITESMDTEFGRNDWSTIAFRGFRELRERKSGSRVKAFLSIGTGTGLDCIGAIECFGPETIWLTELDLLDAQRAQQNVERNLKIPQSINISPAAWDINDDFEETRQKFDLIYENLPNLPMKLQEFPTSGQPLRASFFEAFKDISEPDLVKQWLLSSHYLALIRTQPLLGPAGVVISNIGMRFPLSIAEQMYVHLGLKMELLVLDLKQQNEAVSNLAAYAKWEELEGMEFDFYPAKLVAEVTKLPEYDMTAGFAGQPDRLFEAISAERMPAQEAISRCREGKKIAHVVSCVAAHKE